jgi:DNA polymerase-4
MSSRGSEPPGILHVDMDSFFVSVELLDRPELVGRPVVVGGTGGRGVVASASYEARAYGLHSAQPTAQARRLCPDAVFLPGDHRRYSEVSKRIMEVLGRFTPLVEPLSLDEAFLDVRGAVRLFGSGEHIAAQIRAAVEQAEGLRCSVGVAPNKFLAKLGSEAAKPTAALSGPVPGPGVLVIEPGEELAFLHPLPVGALWGVGPKTGEKLERLAISTVGDLAALPLDVLRHAVGDASGRHLHALAHGRDDRDVVPHQRAKSIGHEETFASDLVDRDLLDRELVRLADGVAMRLRSAAVATRTVVLKVRFGDFRTVTRSLTVPEPVDSGRALWQTAKELLDQLDTTPGVRLLGISGAALVPAGIRQLRLDDDSVPWSDADGAMDRIRARFGTDAIAPASALGARGPRVKRRGDQQWGPDGGHH